MTFNDEEMKKVADSFVASYLKKEQEKETFKQQKMDEVIEKLYKHIQENDIISNEGMGYFPQKYDFSRQEFMMSFDHIFNFAEDASRIWEEKENPFSNGQCQFRYKNIVIELSMVHGQGTSCQMWKAEEENKLIFDYEEFKIKSDWKMVSENDFWEAIKQLNNKVFKEDIEIVLKAPNGESIEVKKPGIKYSISYQDDVFEIQYQDKSSVLKVHHHIKNEDKYNLFQY